LRFINGCISRSSGLAASAPLYPTRLRLDRESNTSQRLLVNTIMALNGGCSLKKDNYAVAVYLSWKAISVITYLLDSMSTDKIAKSRHTDRQPTKLITLPCSTEYLCPMGPETMSLITTFHSPTARRVARRRTLSQGTSDGRTKPAYPPGVKHLWSLSFVIWKPIKFIGRHADA